MVKKLKIFFLESMWEIDQSENIPKFMREFFILVTLTKEDIIIVNLRSIEWYYSTSTGSINLQALIKSCMRSCHEKDNPSHELKMASKIVMISNLYLIKVPTIFASLKVLMIQQILCSLRETVTEFEYATYLMGGEGTAYIPLTTGQM